MKTCVFVLCILLILNKDVSGDAIVDSFMAVFVMYDGNQCDGTVIHSHFIITVSECFLDE